MRSVEFPQFYANQIQFGQLWMSEPPPLLRASGVWLANGGGRSLGAMDGSIAVRLNTRTRAAFIITEHFGHAVTSTSCTIRINNVNILRFFNIRADEVS